MKKSVLYIIFTMSILTFASCGSSNTDSAEQAKDVNELKDSADAPSAMDKNDADFMVDAADGGMMEVELGSMAQQRGIDPLVKNFGVMMVRDHSKANDELKLLAVQKDVSLPIAMSEDKQKHINDMREDKDFDKKYMDMMVSDHKDDIKLFEDIAENGKDADLKAWASMTLMTLRMHLDSAMYIHERIKDKK